MRWLKRTQLPVGQMQPPSRRGAENSAESSKQVILSVFLCVSVPRRLHFPVPSGTNEATVSPAGVRGEAATHRVFGADARLDELEEVFAAAGFGADAGETEAAEGLPADQGAGDPAIQIEIADAEFV